MQECHVNILGFYYLKELYKNGVDFREAFEECKDPISRDTSPWRDLRLQDDLLLKKN